MRQTIKNIIRWTLLFVMGAWLTVSFILLCGEDTGAVSSMSFFVTKVIALGSFIAGIQTCKFIHAKGMFPVIVCELCKEEN